MDCLSSVSRDGNDNQRRYKHVGHGVRGAGVSRVVRPAGLRTWDPRRLFALSSEVLSCGGGTGEPPEARSRMRSSRPHQWNRAPSQPIRFRRSAGTWTWIQIDASAEAQSGPAAFRGSPWSKGERTMTRFVRLSAIVAARAERLASALIAGGARSEELGVRHRRFRVGDASGVSCPIGESNAGDPSDPSSASRQPRALGRARQPTERCWCR
jgi:hypothetical protein